MMTTMAEVLLQCTAMLLLKMHTAVPSIPVRCSIFYFLLSDDTGAARSEDQVLSEYQIIHILEPKFLAQDFINLLQK